MSTRSVDVMLSKPGIYAVCVPCALGFVEVDDQGRCFQLELASGNYARDGELLAGGWNLDAIVKIHGPFFRAGGAA